MKADDSLKEHIYQLEERLLRPETRESEQELNKLLADDFIEFGSSGKTYNKQQVIEALLSELPTHVSITDFNISQLSQDIVLVTYCTTKENFSADAEISYSLRSSIWKLQGGRWQIIFHQGTSIFPS